MVTRRRQRAACSTKMGTQEEVSTDLRVFKIKLPMRIKTSSKKKQALNLNVYRNLHHRSLHAQKREFEKLAKKLLRGIPPLGVITLHYEVFVESKRRLDIMNVGSIVDKYFSDSLTSEGIIKDDDYRNIPRVSFTFGGKVDKEHVLVTITEIEKRKEDTPMRVLLDQADIQKALTTYVGIMGIPNATGIRLKCDAEGIVTAEVTFDETNDDEPPLEDAKPKKRGRGGRPAGSKNKPKIEPKEDDDVGTPVQAGAAGSSEGDRILPDGETPTTADTEVDSPSPKGTAKGNLFGDKENPSSEDDDGVAEEATPDSAPTEEPVAKKRGSIFDA